MDFHTAICMDRSTKYAGVLAGAPTYVAEFFPAVERIGKEAGDAEITPAVLRRVAVSGAPRLPTWQWDMVRGAVAWLLAAEAKKPGTVTAIFGRDPRDPR